MIRSASHSFPHPSSGKIIRPGPAEPSRQENRRVRLLNLVAGKEARPGAEKRIALPQRYHQDPSLFPAGWHGGFGSLTGSGIPRESVPRGEFVLEEITLVGAPYELISVPPRSGAYRKEPYLVFVVPSRDVVIATSNERGNRSFFITGVDRYRRVFQRSKLDITESALHDEGIAHTTYQGEERFREAVRISLSHALRTELERKDAPPAWVTELSPRRRTGPRPDARETGALPVATAGEVTLAALAHRLQIPIRLADRLVADFFRNHVRRDHVDLKREAGGQQPLFHYSKGVQAHVTSRLRRIPVAPPGWASEAHLCRAFKLKPWQMRSLFAKFVEELSSRMAGDRQLMRRGGEILDHYGPDFRAYALYHLRTRELHQGFRSISA